MEQKARVSRLERALETSDQAVQRIQFGVGSLLALVTLCALLFFALRGDDQESFSTAVAVKSHNLVVKRQENEIVIKISCTLRNDGASAELLSASNGKLDFFHAGYDQTYWFSLYDRDGIREEWITINPTDEFSYVEEFAVPVDEWSKINQPMWFTALVKQAHGAQFDHVVVVVPKPNVLDQLKGATQR
jgi:hypothetical protein